MASAAKLQELVPDAALVGGAAAVFRAGQRLSYDHDHVVADLQNRFDVVLDALEREGDWVTNRVAYWKIILGELGGIETGVRQLIRARPLEVERHTLPNGAMLTVPTIDETLRMKAFLIVKRNQARDYLDVAALCDRVGTSHAASVLAGIDEYYADQAPTDGTVAAQVVDQLADPAPKDSTTIRDLAQYKGLAPEWTSWDRVRAVCWRVADAMCNAGYAGQPAPRVHSELEFEPTLRRANDVDNGLSA